MRQKRYIALALTCLLIAGGVFLVSRQMQGSEVIPISGQLNAELGEDKVGDGYYDIRIVSYDTTTGLLLSVQDFPDVQVDDAIYTIPYALPDSSELTKIYYQLCRTGTSTITPDGFDDAKLPVRCESLTQKGSSLPIVECPKTLVVSKQGSATSSYATPNCIEDESTVENVDFAGSNTEKTAVASVFGERGPEGPKGEKGDKGDTGEAGATGPAGSPATDDQTLSFGGASVLTISGGNSVSLASLMDNTDVLASLLCANGEVPLMTLGVWACGSTGGVDTDDQTLSLIANTLAIDSGNSVNLAGYLDNTDAQSLTYVAGTQNLSIAGGNTVNLSSLLDNTDAQALSLATNTLSLVNGGSVSLAPYLDNTDAQALSLASNTLSLVNGGSVNLASYLDNTDAQDLSLAGSTLSLTGDGTSVNLAGFLDNTDAQTLSLSVNTLSISGGNSLSLASYLDNTDSQSLFLTIDTPNGTDPVADGATDTLALADGAGITITGNGATDTVTIAATLGTAVDSSEITDGTVAFTDIAGNGCSANQIFKFNGSVWFCGTDVDTDTTLSEAQVEAYIFDADNTGTLSSGTLALGSLSYTGTLGDANISDALTISSSGTVADGALSANVSLFGASVDSTEITNGTVTGTDLASATIVFSNIAQNGCSTNDIMKWNGSAWACAVDNTGGGGANSFETFNADNGTDPVADSATDTLNLTSGAGVTITGDGTTDTITIAATLGSDITGAEVVDGSIANTDLVNSSITVTAGTGLTGGGSVSLGGTVTLNVTLGTDIDSSEIVNGTITFADIAANGCSSGAPIEYNGSAWICGTDDGITSEVDGSISNELQNLFLTVDTPNGTDPVADGQTDTLTFADGAGVTITGNGTTDTITIATTLGTAIDSSEITDGTITGTDVSDGSIGNTDLANSSLTVSAGTGLTGGGAVSLGGTVTLNLASDFGASIDSSEITNGTIVFADLSANGCSSGQSIEYNGSAWVCGTDDGITSEVDGSTTNELQNIFQTVNAPNGTDPSADSTTDTLDLLDGAGITITGNSTNDSITIASVLGASIDSSEIDNGSIVFADFASNSCGSGEVIKFNGSAWICGTDVDTDTTLSEAQVEAYIFDADNTGTLSSGTLALGSLSYTGTLGDANISDALTISSSGTVADGALSANVSLFGASVDSTEITNGTVTGTDLASATIVFSNIAQNGCSTNDIMKWNGSAWACAADATGGTVNSFETVSADNGTNPVADSSADTLSLVSGSGVTVTGNGATDTITIAATLGAAIDNTEITDGTIINADIADGTISNAKLANSSVTVTAGTGLAGGGAVSLGGTVTLNLTNDFGASIDSGEITDGTVSSTDIANGTILFADIAANGCNNGELFKYNGSAWICGTDLGLTSEVDGSTTNELQNLFLTIATPDANNPAADTQTDTLTLANGSGITITSNGATDTITIAATLGTSVDSGEITDGTIAFADIAANGCGTNEIFKFNGSAWFCGTDNDTTLSEAAVEAFIFDADNTGTLSSGTLALGSLSYTGTLGDTNIADALTISSSGSVADGALSANVSLLGSSVESGEITNGTVTGTDLASATILFSNIAQNGCGSNDVMKWNGSAWACAADVDTDTDAQNLFATINADNGTDPVADGTTDTLNLVSGSGVTITGDNTTDTLTIAAVLGADITSAEIVDGTIANNDLANSSVTVTAGTGLTGGGAVSLGGTVTLNSSLGTDVSSGEIVDGTIAFADIAANGCGTGVPIEYNGSAWICGTDDGITSEVDGSTTNELQNLFLTIDTPNGTDPSADAQSDTLAFADGAGITITGNGTTDTVTIAATLGADITSAEIVDGTVSNTDLTNSSLTVTAGTGLTGGGAVSLGGTVTLNLANDFGASIDSGEITNGTIAFADLGQNSCGTNDIIKWNGSAWACAVDATGGSINSFETFNADNGTDPVADSNTDTLTYTSGAGVTVTGDSTTDTITIAAVLGATIDSSSEIVDGVIANADLVNSSLTVTAGNGLANGGSVALGGSTTLNIGAGNGITVNADDITVRAAASADGLSSTTSSGSGLEVLATGVALLQGCSNNQILKWNETTDVWVCSADVDTDTDAQDLSLAANTLSLTNDGSTVDLSPYLDNTDNQFLFLTFDVDNGTDPAADGASDTLTWVSGAGVTISGNSTTDTITITATLGATIDNTSEVVDGTIANADLVNSGITVVAGSGLVTGGAVSLGGTVTLDVGAGTAITVNGNDVAITADGINYTEIADSLSLDTTTTTALGANNQITNLDGTGDRIFQDNGSTFMTITDTGAYDFTLDATDNPAYTITNAGTSNIITNLSSTGDFVIQDNGTTVLSVLDDGTFQFRNSADSASSFLIENSTGLDIFEIDTVANAVRIGELVDDALDALLVLDGATADPTGIAGGMYYNTTDGKFRCFEGGAWKDCIAELDTATFADTNPAAFADNDTTEIFNDATRPNITVRSTTSTVLVSFTVDGVSDTANDAFFAARVIFDTGGANPSCAADPQVGRAMISTFTTAATHPYSISGSFVHTPGVAGQIRYTVCSSAAATGTITDTPTNVTISLVELGP